PRRRSAARQGGRGRVTNSGEPPCRLPTTWVLYPRGRWFIVVSALKRSSDEPRLNADRPSIGTFPRRQPFRAWPRSSINLKQPPDALWFCIQGCSERSVPVWV